jgi:tetrahydromethanopterin S-methyltransferase subunit F
VLKAEGATNDRFQAVNEFRGSLNDVARVQMPRSEAEQTAKTLTDRIDRIQTQVNDMASRSQGISSVWPLLFGAVGVVGIIFGIVMAVRKAAPTAAPTP